MNSAIFLSIREKATRLPKKVLLPIKGKTVTEHLIDRLKQARKPDRIVLCTSTNPRDTVLVEIAGKCGIPHFCGSEDDKLDRYLQAARQFGIDFIVVADGDDIFCDPDFIDREIQAFGERGADYITTKDLPLGCVSFGVKTRALEQVVAIKSESDTEVWGGYFTQTGLFRVEYVPVEAELRHPEIRLTLDYREDFELIERIFEHLYVPGKVFSLKEILNLVLNHPELLNINARMQELYEKNLKRSAPVRLKADHQKILAAMAGAGGPRL
jgi:spore coat polysaccharide biosynthesis protein SpsF